MGFFFTKETSKKEKLVDVRSFETLYKKGCFVCPLKKQENITSCMNPVGSTSPVIYILGEAPGEVEDKHGVQFIEDSGQILRQYLRRYFYDIYDEKELVKQSQEVMRSKIRFNNCIRCHPPKNRTPTDIELECCRGSIQRDIIETKPTIVIGCGAIPLKWMLGYDKISDWRGRKVPVKIDTHTFWFFPIFHPAYILRKKRKDSKISEEERVFDFDMQRIKNFMQKSVLPIVESNYTEGIDCFLGKDASELQVIEHHLEDFKTVVTAVDIETTCLRPYGENAKILSVAIGTDKKVIAFPIDYPGAWKNNTVEIKQLLKRFLLSSESKICQNLKFELEWFNYFFGSEVIYKTSWEDTMAQAYCLDERVSKEKASMLSLNTLTLLYFGFQLKKLSNVDTTNLINEPLKDVLLYNGMDSRYEYKLFFEQDKLLQKKLKTVYNHLVSVAKTLTITQYKGLPIDLNQVTKFSSQLDTEIKNIEKKINKLPEICEFKKTKSIFNPNSSDDLVFVFRDILNLDEVKKTSKDKYSTDKEVLDTFAEEGVTLAVLVKEDRELKKLKSTYVDAIPGLVSSDKVLHPEFNQLFTRTGRLSSENPNVQNWPKKKNKHIRRIVAAPEGYWIVSVDYGQLEARVIAMASNDKVFCDAIRTNYDIHKEWALKTAKLHSFSAGCDSFEEFKSNKKNVKDFRSIIKNKLVFPWFYGASKDSVAFSLKLPDNVVTKLYEEFWDTYRGVKTWQVESVKFYEKYGYIETLTGRRRRAPLSYTECLNTPIQGTASDLVVDAMNRLSLRAYKSNESQYQAILNVHDDLTFLVPDSLLEESVEVIAREMCTSSYSFVNVPLSVEVSIGRNWADVKELHVFDTTMFAL